MLDAGPKRCRGLGAVRSAPGSRAAAKPKPVRPPYAAPKTLAERRLTLLWAAVLGRSSRDLGVHDDWQGAGGDRARAERVAVARNQAQPVTKEIPLAIRYDRRQLVDVARRLLSLEPASAPEHAADPEDQKS